jgi:hypothetical protein
MKGKAMLNLKKQAAASDGKAAVLVGEFGGAPVLVRYAPRSAGNPENRARFDSLVARALAKLGWKRDRRCRCGYRRVA